MLDAKVKAACRKRKRAPLPPPRVLHLSSVTRSDLVLFVRALPREQMFQLMALELAPGHTLWSNFAKEYFSGRFGPARAERFRQILQDVTGKTVQRDADAHLLIPKHLASADPVEQLRLGLRTSAYDFTDWFLRVIATPFCGHYVADDVFRSRLAALGLQRQLATRSRQRVRLVSETEQLWDVLPIFITMPIPMEFGLVGERVSRHGALVCACPLTIRVTTDSGKAQNVVLRRGRLREGEKGSLWVCEGSIWRVRSVELVKPDLFPVLSDRFGALARVVMQYVGLCARPDCCATGFDPSTWPT